MHLHPCNECNETPPASRTTHHPRLPFSPPRTPAYNGAIEAAIGSLKTRTQNLAVLAGHPERWTESLVEAARRQANASRPRRLHGATPGDIGDRRPRLTAAERERFRATVERLQAEAWLEKSPKPEEPSHWQQAALDRVALRRALVAHDLPLFKRRSIPAQIKQPKTAS